MGNIINQDALSGESDSLNTIDGNAVISLNNLRKEFANIENGYKCSATTAMLETINSDIAGAISSHTGLELENGLSEVITTSSTM